MGRKKAQKTQNKEDFLAPKGLEMRWIISRKERKERKEETAFALLASFA